MATETITITGSPDLLRVLGFASPVSVITQQAAEIADLRSEIVRLDKAYRDLRAEAGALLEVAADKIENLENNALTHKDLGAMWARLLKSG